MISRSLHDHDVGEGPDAARSRRPAPHSSVLVGRGYRYWPVLATVSIVRPGSLPCLP
jgi:hypothetical protein